MKKQSKNVKNKPGTSGKDSDKYFRPESKEELKKIEFGHVKITKQNGEVVFIETKKTKKVK